MKIITVVGARPQLIKAAAVSNVLRQAHEEILIHTGQHYDNTMSDIFFSQLGIPQPDYNLGIGSGMHGEMTGRMLTELEKLYMQLKPDVVMVYGDTNSTLAGALAASKLLIPVAHVEAGLRSYDKAMPEEQNRIVTDHLSDWLFVPTAAAEKCLKSEGVTDGVHNVGDVMYDAVLHFMPRVDSSFLEEVGATGDYLLATIHRAENTDSKEKLTNIVEAFNNCGHKVILPLHPRTAKYLEEYGLSFADNVYIIEPVGYLEMLGLEAGAKKILTDSGGVQKEAYFLKKPCINLRTSTEWTETVEAGWNLIVGTDKERILDAVAHFEPQGTPPAAFGDGHAAEKISQILSASVQ